MEAITNNKWTRDEELILMKEISNGETLEDISTKHHRSIPSVELRLKKIIFENVNGGKKIENVASVLNLPVNKIREYFYSYKEFREKHKSIEELDNANLEESKSNELTKNNKN